MATYADAEPSTSQIKKKEKKEEKKEKKKGKKEKEYVYQKRAGTSGIRGQLYETKLLSLIYFKVLHDEVTEEFYLGTNADEIGMFDDICLRAKLNGFKKQIAVFVQAKHRENDKLVTLNSKKDLANCFDSYLKIKRRFEPNNEDVLFKGTFSEIDCLFVFYTTAKDDHNIPCDGSLFTYLNDLIKTGNPGAQPTYTDEDMEVLCEQVLEEQLVTLAQKIAKYMFDDAKGQLMNDDHLLRFHVILAQNIFEVSEIQAEGHRIATFRQDFFSQTEKFLKIFIDALISEILEEGNIDIKNETQSLLTDFVTKSDDSEIISKLVSGGVITYKCGNLEFRDKAVPQKYKIQLDRINSHNKQVRDEAVKMAVKKCKPLLEFKVPSTFGNKDLAIRGDDVKIGKRLDHLCKKLKDLIDKTETNIIVIDDSMEDGVLRLNGGISSAVGNILVSDDNSDLFKINDDYESLESIAKLFYTKLHDKIQNLHDFKFDLRSKLFPKLTLKRSEYDKEIVKDFFRKLVFYTSQGDEKDVESKIIDEIKKKQEKFEKAEKSEAIYLKYHDEVQKWWMTKEGSYLTKKSDSNNLYKKAVKSTNVASMIPDIKFSQHVVCVKNGRIVNSYDPLAQ